MKSDFHVKVKDKKMTVTSKEYKRIKEKMREEIIQKFLDECQCEEKKYEDKFLFATITTKYEEEQYRVYQGMIAEESEIVWRCPICGKLYKLPEILIA